MQAIVYCWYIPVAVMMSVDPVVSRVLADWGHEWWRRAANHEYNHEPWTVVTATGEETLLFD